MSWLKRLLSPKANKVITPDVIIDEVASYYGITIADIKGTKRSNKISNPRQLTMYLLRELTDITLANIGEFLGGKDHSTVMYGLTKIEKQLSDPNSTLIHDIDQIKKHISA